MCALLNDAKLNLFSLYLRVTLDSVSRQSDLLGIKLDKNRSNYRQNSRCTTAFFGHQCTL